MSEIARFEIPAGWSCGVQTVDGLWVRYEDHLAEVERLTDAGNDHHCPPHCYSQQTMDAMVAEAERLRAEVERLTAERDDAAKAERARCMAVIRRLQDLLPTGEQKRSQAGVRDALLAIGMLDQSIDARETEDTP